MTPTHPLGVDQTSLLLCFVFYPSPVFVVCLFFPPPAWSKASEALHLHHPSPGLRLTRFGLKKGSEPLLERSRRGLIHTPFRAPQFWPCVTCPTWLKYHLFCGFPQWLSHGKDLLLDPPLQSLTPHFELAQEICFSNQPLDVLLVKNLNPKGLTQPKTPPENEDSTGLGAGKLLEWESPG